MTTSTSTSATQPPAYDYTKARHPTEMSPQDKYDREELLQVATALMAGTLGQGGYTFRQAVEDARALIREVDSGYADSLVRR